jgi:DNA (cytosine-5)-methyltransferase 1
MMGVIPLGGGMTIGFEQAGFESLPVMLEVNEEWTANLRLNRPEILEFGTSLDEWARLIDEMKEAPVLIYGSPPCQGVTGASKASSADNPKNQWMLHFADAVVRAKPQYAMAENIERMLTIGRPIVNQMDEILRRNGYTMSVHHHAVEDFGVCQRRKRIMFVIERKGYEMHWPNHEPKQAPTLWEVISDLDDDLVMPHNPDDNEAVPVFFYADDPHNEYQAALRNPAGVTWQHDLYRMPDHYVHVPQGKPWFAMPVEHMTEKELDRLDNNRLYNAMEPFRMHPDRVARTLTGARTKIHPHRERALSVRESSRLMAFPDEWRWAKPRDTQQFAAGVCPPVTKWLGEVMMHALAGTPLETKAPVGRLF